MMQHKMNDNLDQISNEDNESIDSDRFRSINQIFKETTTTADLADVNKKRQSRSFPVHSNNTSTGATAAAIQQPVTVSI